MGLRDLLKKDKIDKDGPPADHDTVGRLAAPEVTFIRSDTFTREVIHPPEDPSAPAGAAGSANYLSPSSTTRRSVFSSSSSRSRGSSVSSRTSMASGDNVAHQKPSAAKRLSRRLHLSRSPASSENVPQNLPEIVAGGDGAGEGSNGGDGGSGGGGDEEDEGRAAERQSQWEKRATMLAHENERMRSRPGTPGGTPSISAVAAVGSGLAQMSIGVGGAGNSKSSQAIDENIQEAIRLHESGQLEQSTRLFGKLADPGGANNPLSQVLYGLALRHGWGCEPDAAGAVHYLTKAASNAAAVENLALQAGMKKGGAAKGELVLAIFELANCFRHGWGVPKDAIAAKQYYETAANLGDTDAMNEVAWCYLEGFGGKKDKFAAAKYYRLAEKNGSKTLGNSWIWKEKYDPGSGKK